MMFSRLAALLMVFALSATQAQERTWNYRVLLDSQEIGRHQFTVRHAGGAHEVRSQAQFDVRVLFISAYRYQHEALERWDGDCLRTLTSNTQTNGERQTVNAEQRNGRLLVVRDGTQDVHEGCIMSFAYWNPKILTARQLLNSQTGELMPVTIAALGEQTAEVRGQPISTQRYRIRGPKLQIDLWYADQRWIALEALAQGGRLMRYELI